MLTGYGKVYKQGKVSAGFFENGNLNGKGIVYSMTPNSIPADAIWDNGEVISPDQDIIDFTTNS